MTTGPVFHHDHIVCHKNVIYRDCEPNFNRMNLLAWNTVFVFFFMLICHTSTGSSQTLSLLVCNLFLYFYSSKNHYVIYVVESFARIPFAMFCLRNYLAFTSLLLTVTNAEHSKNETLSKIIVVFRHGMRAPIKPFNLLSTFNEEVEYWPHGYGALVDNGRDQLFHLGRRLSQHYRNLMEPRNDNVAKDFQVVTTSVHRCYESAQNLLAGFFSLSPGWTRLEAVEKQPVPILYQSPDKTTIIGKETCPKYGQLLKTSLPDFNSSEIQYFRHFIMSHASHLNMTSLNDIFMFADYIKILDFMNLELPRWVTTEFKKKLEKFFNVSFHWLSSSTDMIRLLSGPLIEDITVRFREAIYGEPSNSKMFLYSGHDVSLHSLSKLLGLPIDFSPYFGSSLIFEVHRLASTDFRIRTLFNHDYSFDNVQVWRLPGCEEFCPVGKFVQLVEKFFVKDWSSECLSK